MKVLRYLFAGLLLLGCTAYFVGESQAKKPKKEKKSEPSFSVNDIPYPIFVDTVIYELSEEQMKQFRLKYGLTTNSRFNKQPSKPFTGELPTFQGGDINTFSNWVNRTVRYPKEAIDQNIQGTVTVRFIIEKDGTVSNVEVIKRSNHLLNVEALRVIKSSPRWEPGYKDGEPVRVWCQVPIRFIMQ